MPKIGGGRIPELLMACYGAPAGPQERAQHLPGDHDHA
jgi:hypothetical protein